MDNIRSFFKNIWLYRILAITCYLVATVLFFSPIDPNSTDLFPHFDKFAHCIVFFSLAGLTEFSLKNKSVWIILGLIFYGGAVEVLQGQFFNREASFLDLMADISGIAFFYLFLTKTKLSCFRSWVAAQ